MATGTHILIRGRVYRVLAALIISIALRATSDAADWPQYMHDAMHTAYARGEQLSSPLTLAARVKLDDAILTSPAVVGGRVYVVDQMGTAHCVDPQRAAVVWKTRPPGADAAGGNTSSPCVIDGRMAYGTTAGKFYLLDVETGKVLRRVEFDQPILGAITAANGRFYLQTLDGIIHCLDEEGDACWRYDAYADAPRIIRSRSKRQYSGTPVAVLGDTVVAAIGFDLICLRDKGVEAEQVWLQKRPISDVYLPVGVSLANGWVYASFPGKDGEGAIVRIKLETGEVDSSRDVIKRQWAVLTPPATRDGVAYYCRQAFGLSAASFGEQRGVAWSTFSSLSAASNIPAIAAPTLAGEHCLFTSLGGALKIARLPAAGAKSSDRVVVQTIATPTGAVVTSSPAVADGAVYFGSDDGSLYIARSTKGASAVEGTNGTPRRRSELIPGGDKRYDWPSAFGGSANANFVDDVAIKPPFRLRWAMKCSGLFKQTICATEDDVVYVTLGGLVVCREQMTGRIRWRRHLPGQAWCRSALLAAGGRIYVPRMFSQRYPKSRAIPSTMFCLSIKTGAIEWQAPIGIGDRLRASPVYADGVVAFGSLSRSGVAGDDDTAGQSIDAWDAATGKHLWRVGINSSGKFLNGPAGCAGDGTMYFTGGGEGLRDAGETIAVEPQTGRVLWRTTKAFASQTGTPSYKEGHVYLPGTYRRPVACLEAENGEIVWTNDRSSKRWHVDTIALGPDYFSVNNKYRGGAWRWDLKIGKPVMRDDKPLQLWGPAHGCGAIVLTSSGHALSATIGGLCMTDVNTGKLAWNTAGFGSYTCPHPIAASGRIFYAPQTSGMLFCYEPVAEKKAGQ